MWHLEFILTDVLVPLHEVHWQRVRPPRLLVLVNGRSSGEPKLAGVCGVSLGRSIAEHGPPEGAWPHAKYEWTEVCVSGVAPPLAWRDLGLDEVRQLFGAITALGLPAAEPDVVPVVDISSDLVRVTTVMGAIDGRPFRLCLQGIYWGYRGRDAPAFLHLLRIVFGLARIDATAERWRVFRGPGRHARIPEVVAELGWRYGPA
jgi:hypothetical protein